MRDSLHQRSWALAQLGIAQGGLGVRDPARHAPAAYFASLQQSRELCGRLDLGFEADDASGGSLLADTEQALRGSVLEGASWNRGEVGVSQKDLSGMLDAAALEQLKRDEAQDASFLAHVELCRLAGAGAWLTANPVEDGREIDSPLFNAALRRRLRVPFMEEDGFCPCCGGVMDRWGDHASVCACGGDRTIRHNAVRDIVFQEAAGASLRPEREKAGLLPHRPLSDDMPPPAPSARRPADVWLPRGATGHKEALDFAITSAMRSDFLRRAVDIPESVFTDYDRRKREHIDTGQQFEAAGMKFIPMVVESHAGAWSPAARGVLDWIAAQAAASQHESHQLCSLRIAQRTSCTLHRENARAILRRLVVVEPAPPMGGWAAAAAGPWQ